MNKYKVTIPEMVVLVEDWDQPPVEVPPTTPEPEPLEPGLVGYWNMQDIDWSTNKIYDRSGAGNHGDLVGMTQADNVEPGRFQDALKFNGIDEWLEFPESQTLNYRTTGAFTQAAWINISAFVGSDFRPFVWKDVNQQLSANSSGLTLARAGQETVQLLEYSPYLATLDTWHHVIQTYDGATHNLYFNGVLRESKASTGSVGAISSMKIGNDGTGRGVECLIDEVRIYDKALTADEVMELYSRATVESAPLDFPEVPTGIGTL